MSTFAGRRIESKSKLKWYDLYTWTDLNLKNSMLRIRILPKATQIFWNWKLKFEFYIDKLNCVVIFYFSFFKGRFIVIVGRRREELERVRGGFQLKEEERTERVSLIKYGILKYIIAWISLGHHFCHSLMKWLAIFRKRSFYFYFYFFSMNLKGF